MAISWIDTGSVRSQGANAVAVLDAPGHCLGKVQRALRNYEILLMLRSKREYEWEKYLSLSRIEQPFCPYLGNRVETTLSVNISKS